MKDNSYLEEKIKSYLAEMGSSFAELQHRREMNDLTDDNPFVAEEQEIQDVMMDGFYDTAKSVYKLIIFYIEASGRIEYLSAFKLAVNPYLIDRKSVLKGMQNPYHSEIESEFLDQVWDYLSAYEAFGDHNPEYLFRRTGIHFLENILRNTAVIITDLKENPKSEAAVYNIVKFAINATFPGIEEPTTAFVTNAQEYKPDILIPYLNCAVEYKYAVTEAKLKATIDTIHADVKGYDNHPIYKLFYAVFYVKPGIWGDDHFNAVWKEKKFPDNWKPIFVIGSFNE